MSDSTPTLEQAEWRCFHCGDVFTDETCARAHFGPTEDSKPACLIKAGAEGSLVRALREAEKEAEDAWAAIHNEGTEAAQAYYRQQTRHYAQLQAAEEAGYERGLADARALDASGNDELVEALKDAREAIASLEDDALGTAFPANVTSNDQGWPIRDELLAKIDAAIARTQERSDGPVRTQICDWPEA